jgi:hypothetical protein
MSSVGYAKSAWVAADDRVGLRRELRARYEAGASIRTLARETGRSYGFVWNLLTESGVTFRPRGGWHGKS